MIDGEVWSGGEGARGSTILYGRSYGRALLVPRRVRGVASPTLIPTPEPTSTPVPTATATPTPPPALAPTSEPFPYVRLPQDEGAHLTSVEWWYFNGHLTADTGQDYSYHFVTFQLVLPDGPTVRIAQLSWADHSEGVHLIAELPELVEAEETSGEFDGSVSSWQMTGDSEDYSLAFQVGEYEVEMQATSRKPAALHDGNGYVDLGVAGKTYYYSPHELGDLRFSHNRRKVPGAFRHVLDGPPVGRLHHCRDRLGLAEPIPGRRLGTYGFGGLGERQS